MLLPFQDYLATRGLQLPPADGAEIDYEALIEIVTNPDGAMPRELMDCLYFVGSSGESVGNLRLSALGLCEETVKLPAR